MMHLVIAMSAGQLAGLGGLIWRVERWAFRLDARVTYLEDKAGGGLYTSTKT